MMRVNGTTISRWSLRLDAAYCAVLGIAVALWAGPIAEGVRLPELLIATVGIAVAGWGPCSGWRSLCRWGGSQPTSIFGSSRFSPRGEHWSIRARTCGILRATSPRCQTFRSAPGCSSDTDEGRAPAASALCERRNAF